MITLERRRSGGKGSPPKFKGFEKLEKSEFNLRENVQRRGGDEGGRGRGKGGRKMKTKMEIKREKEKGKRG